MPLTASSARTRSCSPAGSLAIGTTANLSASLTLAGGTIDGGTIDLTGGATLVGTSIAAARFGGVTLDGTLDMTGYAAVRHRHRRLDLERHHRPRRRHTPYYLRRLHFLGAQTLGGTGSIVFGGTRSGNQINTASANGDSGTLTIGSGITIDGDSGAIGYNGGGNRDPARRSGDDRRQHERGHDRGLRHQLDQCRHARIPGRPALPARHLDRCRRRSRPRSGSDVYLRASFTLGSGYSFTGSGNLELVGTLNNTGTTLSRERLWAGLRPRWRHDRRRHRST